MEPKLLLRKVVALFISLVSFLFLFSLTHLFFAESGLGYLIGLLVSVFIATATYKAIFKTPQISKNRRKFDVILVIVLLSLLFVAVLITHFE